MIRPPPRSTLFPSTTLFRSLVDLTRPREEYALGVAVDLLLLDEEQSRREKDPVLPRLDDDFLHAAHDAAARARSEEHTSELQSRQYLVCRLLLEKKNNREEC